VGGGHSGFMVCRYRDFLNLTVVLSSRPAEKYKVEMPKIQSEVQNDPLRIPIP
jgi:hypothetical protein